MNTVTRYYLEMNTPSQLRGKHESRGLSVVECEIKQYQLNRFLYQYVGKAWEWVDKLVWDDAQWEAYVERKSLRTWLAQYKGSVAGYFELEQVALNEVNIAYFGLAEPFIGQGFGGYFLTQAIEAAWRWDGVERVTVNTCTLDHPSALNNYQARGFVIYDEVKEGA